MSLWQVLFFFLFFFFSFTECFIYTNLHFLVIVRMKCTFNLCECLITLVWYIVSQIEILLGKTENFDELMAAAAEEREAGDVEEQQS